MNCPLCEKPSLVEVVGITSVPVFCNVLYGTEAEARAATLGDIDLRFCPSCGLLVNTAFDESLLDYSPEYDNSLHFSPRFREFVGGLVRHLVEDRGISHGTVVEIGSGSGDFLSLLCEAGDNVGIGYDPSHDPHRAPPIASDRVTVRAEPYPVDRPVDALLVCSQHVLEHLHDPSALEVLRGVRSSLSPGDGTLQYHEVPDATYMVETGAIWDLIYEHVSYFAEPTMRAMVEAAGFEVIDSGRSFGDQYLWVEAVTGAQNTAAGFPAVDLGRLPTLVEEFGRRHRSTMELWDQRLSAMLAEGEVVVWGAGSKGVSFLNQMSGASEIGRLVDVNPRKRGRHVPGTGQVIVAPADLVDSPPTHVIVMNPLYTDEVSAMLAELGVGSTVHAMG
ncbi:MAG TPA: methyltransferase domain-containing protein [Acidimicrobiales bacterium]|nr:methyltransferase domain-containing protein [Acidimicrobiales bacterium]